MTDKALQCNMILEHMRTIGAITRADAFELYGCANLPARITDLRQSGHRIQTIMTEGKNRYGKAIHYARYILNDAV